MSQRQPGRGRSGTVGGAAAFLFDAAGMVDFAVQWLEARFGEARQ